MSRLTLMLCLALVGLAPPPILAQSTLLSTDAFDSENRFVPRVTYSYDSAEYVGRRGGLSSFQAFFPFLESDDSRRLMFLDSRLLLLDDRGSLEPTLVWEPVFCPVGGTVPWAVTSTTTLWTLVSPASSRFPVASNHLARWLISVPISTCPWDRIARPLGRSSYPIPTAFFRTMPCWLVVAGA